MKTDLSLGRLLVVAGVSFQLVGCVSLEGVGIGKGDFGVEELVEQSKDQGSTEDNAPESKMSELLLVGTVSAFRKFDDTTVQRFYKQYVAFAERMHPGEGPTYLEHDFRERIVGWTKAQGVFDPACRGTV